MEELLIGMAINVVLAILKKPEQREKFKAALLKVRNAISAAFPGE